MSVLSKQARARRGRPSVRELILRACDCVVGIEYPDEETKALLVAGFGGLLAPSTSALAATASWYRVKRGTNGRGFWVADPQGHSRSIEDAGRLLYYLDKHLTIRLQQGRPDLLFLHAAVVALGGHAAVLVAPTGTGKSTLTLALLEAGFSYLSDELAPIDVQRMTVHPYAHALCLKSRPAAAYRWRANGVADGGRFFVPVELLPGTICTQPLPVAAVIVLQRGPAEDVSRSISAGTAAAHVLANALNALAHPRDGLDAAATLSESVTCFVLNNSDLQAGCAGVRKVLCDAAPFPSATVRDGLTTSWLTRRAEIERRPGR